MCAIIKILSLLIITTSLFSRSLSQNITCNNIFLSYTSQTVQKIPPNLTTLSKQPYKFKSTLTILNNGFTELKSWQVFIGFKNQENLVSASNAILTDGSILPAKVGNGTILAGYPSTDLKTAFDTAGDLSQYSTKVELIGSLIGVKDVSLPEKISVANEGFLCDKMILQGMFFLMIFMNQEHLVSASTNVELIGSLIGVKDVSLPDRFSIAKLGLLCDKMVLQGNRTMQTCCREDPAFKPNTTTDTENFLPRQKGDLTIMFDITHTYNEYYRAQVSIENHHPLGRLDYWQLSWDWMRQEFIDNMKGAYPDLVDPSPCIDGPQGQYYESMDFSGAVLNCERRPTLIDLPLEKTNDTTLGMIPSCCRNGTILPKSMDASKSKSVFQIQVHKMPPNLNRTDLSPPQNWKIKGTLNPEYVCGPPVRVSPSEYPDFSGLRVNKTTFASWQVVCNITRSVGSNPKCCVSFSAFYNESVVPCKTCACGCSSATSQSCSTTSKALLLPAQALLLPFDNRTKYTEAWASLKHLPVPDPLPCGDNCGVSINWHLLSDYKRGWTTRVTVFNWDETPFADWFTAVQLVNGAPGFEKAYSFNGTAFNSGTGDKNNTVFMQGLPGLNYIVGESDGKDPKKDPRVPGKQQSVLSFTKKTTPGINVVAGDGFPTKVYFNGEECSLPDILPASSAHRNGVSVFLAVIVFFFLMWPCLRV